MGGSLNPIQRDTTIYSLAIPSSYGAFAFVIGASLAGLPWTEEYLKAKGKQRLLMAVLWAKSSVGRRLGGCIICSPCWGDGCSIAVAWTTE